MLKKFCSVLMIFALLTGQAFATSKEGLKTAFDELNYSLTVEWDQRDQAFYDSQVNKFMDTLEDLKEEGLTNTEIREFSFAQIKNRKLAADLHAAFDIIGSREMSLTEAQAYVKNVLENSYNEGASWNARGLATFALIAVLAFAVLYVYYELDS